MESPQKRKRNVKKDNIMSRVLHRVYTFSMSVLVKATAAKAPKTKDSQRIAIFYAIILVAMAVAQLYSFDEFLKHFVDFGFPGGDRAAYFLAAFLVTVEVFAIPFLLRMSLSPAFRWVSMICGWLVALLWLKITIWLAIHDGIASNVGFPGTVASITPGWWAVFMSIALGILAAWASWGLWPRRVRK